MNNSATKNRDRRSPSTDAPVRELKKAPSNCEVSQCLTSVELRCFCNANEAWLTELVENGVLEPEESSFKEWRFHLINIARAKNGPALATWSRVGILVKCSLSFPKRLEINNGPPPRCYTRC